MAPLDRPPPGSKRTASGKCVRSPKKKAGGNRFDDVGTLLEDEKSPLYKDSMNLKAVLQHPLAVSALNHEGQGSRLWNLTSEDFASASAAFKEDGRSGRHDHEWVRQATSATKKRRTGEFDEFLRQRFEEQWAEEDDKLSVGGDDGNSSNDYNSTIDSNEDDGTPDVDPGSRASTSSAKKNESSE